MVLQSSEIESIELIGEEETFDIEMPNVHNFIANKIISHNSHSAAYAKIAYQSQWLKANYPLEFWTTALQFATEEEIPDVISELKKTHPTIRLMPPSINNSNINFACNVAENAIYWSLIKIKGIGEASVRNILEERKKGKFLSYFDFVNRVPKKSVNKKHLEAMIFSGCFDTIEGICNPIERQHLINKHVQLKKCEPPIEMSNPEWIAKEYNWIIKQRQLTGLGIVKYKELLKEQKNKKWLELFVDSDILQKQRDYTEVVVTGQAGEIQRRTYRKDRSREFFIIPLRHNYDEIKVLVWEDVSREYPEFLATCQGKQIAVHGKCRFDTYVNAVSVYSFEKTDFITL